jgi:hypothetical protein
VLTLGTYSVSKKFKTKNLEAPAPEPLADGWAWAAVLSVHSILHTHTRARVHTHTHTHTHTHIHTSAHTTVHACMMHDTILPYASKRAHTQCRERENPVASPETLETWLYMIWLRAHPVPISSCALALESNRFQKFL